MDRFLFLLFITKLFLEVKNSFTGTRETTKTLYIVLFIHIWADVAEWLRRLTRNQIPFGSAGSNPAICGKNYFCRRHG